MYQIKFNIVILKPRLTLLMLNFLLLSVVFTQASCSVFSRSKTEKQLRLQEKKKAKTMKIAEKEYQKDLKKHRDVQNKQTKKRMKQTRKRSERARKNAKPNFLTRWFQGR